MVSHSVIRSVLFDLGNVLVKFTHERMHAQVAAVCGCSTDEIREWLWDSGWQARLETGRATAEEVWQELCRRSGREIDREELRRAGADIFTLNEPIVPLLDRLKQAGYRLVLLSNTSLPHIDWIRRQWDVLERFDSEVLSFDVGVLKPERAIYLAAVTAAECEPGECFFTDDLAENVEAAREVGIHAEVFGDVAGLIAQLREVGIEV